MGTSRLVRADLLSVPSCVSCLCCLFRSDVVDRSLLYTYYLSFCPMLSSSCSRVQGKSRFAWGHRGSCSVYSTLSALFSSPFMVVLQITNIFHPTTTTIHYYRTTITDTIHHTTTTTATPYHNEYYFLLHGFNYHPSSPTIIYVMCFMFMHWLLLVFFAFSCFWVTIGLWRIAMRRLVWHVSKDGMYSQALYLLCCFRRFISVLLVGFRLHWTCFVCLHNLIFVYLSFERSWLVYLLPFWHHVSS